jgi:hypothetical protein
VNGDRPGETRPPGITAAISRADRAGLASFVRENLARLSESEVLRCLRHPYAGEAVVAEVLAVPGLLSNREIRKAVVLHPAAPRADALRLLEDLPWRDLADVGRDARAPAPVRFSAHRRVLETLPRLSLGEKTALARLADRPLIGALLDDGEVDVLGALLANPRLVEEDLTAWLLVRRPREPQLVELSRCERWVERTAVRTALLLSPRTPRAIALSLLSGSARMVLARLARDPSADPLLAACARSILERGGSAGVDRSEEEM